MNEEHPKYKRIETVKESLKEIAELLASDEFYEKAQHAFAHGREFSYAIRIKKTNSGYGVYFKFSENYPAKQIRNYGQLKL